MSILKVHHLNCGTHRPLGGRLFDGRSSGLNADLCTHCVLLETSNNLVLLDTGYGLQDVAGSPQRLSHLWPFILNIELKEQDTAIRQIEALGFDPRDVRDVLLTHLDFDHAGGVSDFPWAQVHVLGTEHDHARQRHGFIARQRYRPLQWIAGVNWQFYPSHGEEWFGFDAVRAAFGLGDDLLLVPLPGHTIGHAGIAINTDGGWLLDAGDAYLHHDQLSESGPNMPIGLAAYERIMATLPDVARSNLDRIRELKHSADARIFCSHDLSELLQLQTGLK